MANGHSNHDNYLKFGQNKASGGAEADADADNMMFFEEQLFDAKQALFSATTVREIKFLQSKINYLQTQVTEMQKKDRVKIKNSKKSRGKRPKIIRFQPRAML